MGLAWLPELEELDRTETMSKMVTQGGERERDQINIQKAGFITFFLCKEVDLFIYIYIL